MKHPYLNEAKKELYKEKPIAKYYGQGTKNRLDNNTEWCNLYSTKTSNFIIEFDVPQSEGYFGNQEYGQLLIRWVSKILKVHTTEPTNK